MGKRRTALLMAGVLAAAALTGCGGASGEKEGAKEKVRLMVWSPSEDQSKDSGEWLQNVADKIIANKPCLTEVDSAIGDGDHGIGMAGGMQKAKKSFSRWKMNEMYIRYLKLQDRPC